MFIQFNAGSGARPKQPTTITAQCHIDNLDERYYQCLITVMEYLEDLSFAVAKRKSDIF
jgi:hypothetical protein